MVVDSARAHRSKLRKIRARIKERADGTWHPIEVFMSWAHASRDDTVAALERKRKDGLVARAMKVERRENGNLLEYRAYPEYVMVSAHELTDKLAPLVKELIAEGRKKQEGISPAIVLVAARTLQKHLDGWAERSIAKGRSNRRGTNSSSE